MRCASGVRLERTGRGGGPGDSNVPIRAMHAAVLCAGARPLPALLCQGTAFTLAADVQNNQSEQSYNNLCHESSTGLQRAVCLSRDISLVSIFLKYELKTACLSNT